LGAWPILEFEKGKATPLVAIICCIGGGYAIIGPARSSPLSAPKSDIQDEPSDFASVSDLTKQTRV